MKKNAYKEMFLVEDKHWWYVTLHNLVMLLVERLYSEQPLRILDAGCGTGGLLSILSKAGHDTEGFDFSEDALRLCHQRGLQKIIKADINTWVPDPNTYNIIASMDVLCHEWVQDEIQVLRNLAGGLKENGLLMLNYPAFPILSRHHDKVVMIRERYTKTNLRQYLEQAGLTPVILSYRLPHAFLFLILLRMYETIQKDSGAKSDIADIPSDLINRLLIKIGSFENSIITKGVSLPFGSSLFVVAKKI